MLSLATLLKLAWRNLWRNYRRTVIMLLAITLGVWAMIFMNAFMVGMVDDMVRTGVETLPGHAQLHNSAYRDDPSVVNSMDPAGEVIKTALDNESVAGWVERVRVPAIVASERDSRGLSLLGIDPVQEIKLGFAPDQIIDGRFLDGVTDRGIVLGARLVERLETGLGKRVVVMSQDPDNNVADRGFRIVGIYRARLPMMEEQAAYVGRETLQAMLGVGQAISEIAVLGDDYRDLSAWYPQLQSAVQTINAQEVVLNLAPWTELDGYLATMLKFQDGMLFIFVGVIFLVLSFGLVNTIVMAVYERMREFGLMQALGMRPVNILLQVLVESVLLLLIGLLIGNVLAWATIVPLESGVDISFLGEALELAGMGAVLYPTLYIQDMVTVSILVVGLGLLASLLPAWRASQLDPIEALGKN